MTKPAPDGPPVRRIDRILAFMSIGLVALAILSFFALMIAQLIGGVDFREGVWPVVRMLPLIALPIGFVLILTLLIMSFVRRNRENKA
jgi:ABC-type transport system involved in multi-copper enzyme maturation permease subunit